MPGQPSLGVDFGTSHTVAVTVTRSGPNPLLFDGSPLLPSAVYADRAGALLVGTDALHAAGRDPARCEPHPKRRVDDGSVLLGEQEVTVTALFTAVLRRVSDEYRRVTGGGGEVVLTHPATWGETRRSLLTAAAEDAGLGEVRLLPEPVAAAAYFATRPGDPLPVGHRLMVVDVGGGTVDVSVVRRVDTGFEVLAVGGRDDIGGTDLDALVAEWLRGHPAASGDWSWLDSDTAAARRSRRQWYEEARNAKVRLSRHSSTELFLPTLEREVLLTRAELERLAHPTVTAIADLAETVAASAGTGDEPVVYLVGGGSRMPLVGTLLHRRFGIAPVTLEQPELVVAQGAATAPRVRGTGADEIATASVMAHAPVAAPTPTEVIRGEDGAEVPPAPDRPPATEPAPEPAEEPTLAAPAEPVAAEPLPDDTTPTPDRPRRIPGPLRVVALVVAVLVVATIVASRTGWFGLGDEAQGGHDTLEADPVLEGPAVFTGHEGTVIDLDTVAVDGRPTLVTAGEDGGVCLWDVATGDSLDRIDAHDSSVTALAVGTTADDVPIAVTGDGDGVVRVWDLTEREQIFEYTGHASGIRALALMRAGTSTFVVSGDESFQGLRGWRLDTGEQVLPFTDAPDMSIELESVIIGDKSAVVAADSGVNLVWSQNFIGDSVPRELRVSGHLATALAAGEIDGGPVVAVSMGAGEPVSLWNLTTGERLGEYGEADSRTAALAIVEWNGRALLAVGGAGGIVRVFDVDTGDVVDEFDVQPDGETDEIPAIAFTAVGDDLAVCSATLDRIDVRPVTT
ncbi:WD domain G-beta repeat uncharacterized protein [Stackebrandtia albiflava]|uniref:WD domain G-beta repeat uncharacterized protein n=1 Tax=Stackebrandtia albiflava TaxID=406432 RepID=A0A562VBK2_9ACTN|nr:Hsp70 family protein [Stackebrandtia albiflava]TWJ15232.1 WD domain G-beta repeat uncharacterized protein [Stackebrandtia albiflava]